MTSLLYGLAGKLVGELCSPLFKDYIGKPWEFGTKSEFEKLKNTLSTIEAVLLDAEEKQRTNHQVRDWLIKIKLIFYDLEDLFLEISYEALKCRVRTKNKKAKKVRVFFSRSNQLKYRFKMGRKVKSIRERLDAISSDSNRFSLAQRHEEMSATTRSHRREGTHSFVSVEKFIGRDADKENVTKLLLESDGIDNVSVISIIGIGGLGKTTLAQSIYSSEEVKCNFELMMWVCVSDPFDVKLICENIIKSATQNQCKGLPMDVVKDKLKSLIDGEKYLLVLDDVWNECPDEWMKLEVLLTGGAKGSNILITARSELVSRATNSVATHVLKGLSHEESWALFKQVAFKRGIDQTSSTVRRIGNKVVDMCAGVPLAVKTIGSILGLKRTTTDWLDFKKNVLPLITKDNEGKIVRILKLSYDNLSAPLKRCFVYCAIYPKDWDIEKDILVRMWMAHGLIQLDGTTRSLEDIGEQHFIDLMDRSLLEAREKDDFDGIINSCKMHDLIHDLALSVGGNEFWSSGSGVNCIDMTTRHAWVSNPSPSVSTNLLHAKKLRTLVVRNSFETHKNDIIIGDFERMRVLDFADLRIDRVPDIVYRLRFLNYLDLSGNQFESLPESICSLYNLQTLILSLCPNLKELPAGTRNLVSLRHLDVSFCHNLGRMPRGFGELTSLQTLSDFVMGPEGANCCELVELRSMVNLRGRLTIRKLRGAEGSKCRSSRNCFNPTPLEELQFLPELVLEWNNEIEVHKEEKVADELENLKPHPNLEKLFLCNYVGMRFPTWMNRANIRVSLPNIVSISLISCKGLQHLPPLELLPCLRLLELWDLGDIQYIYDNEGDNEWNNDNNRCFPVLEKMVIKNCPLLFADGRQFLGLNSLRKLSFSGHIETLSGWLPSIPHLQTLELFFCSDMVSLPEWMGNLKSLHEIRLANCNSLKSIPDWIRHLASLHQLQIQSCPELYRRYNKESGEYWHKIAQIPNISVTEC